MLRALLRRIAGDESGVSLIELLIACLLAVVVSFGAYQFMDTAGRSQASTSARSESLQQVQHGLERMTRDLRQAATVSVPTSQEVVMSTYLKPAAATSALQTVRYLCAAVCTRQVNDGAAATVVRGVRNVDVFDPEPDVEPRYVGIRLRVGVAGADRPLTLVDGVEIRNRQR